MPIATAFIVGASSQLSQEMARQLSAQGVELALFAQNSDDLTPFIEQLPSAAHAFELSIDQPQQTVQQLETAWQQLGGAHLVVINTGFNQYHPDLPWQLDQAIIQVNVQGFAAIANTCFKLLCEQGYGQLAAINSIAGMRGGSSVSFHASKAFSANYLEGLSMHAQRLKLPITMTDIQLGLLDKAAMQQSRLWSAPIPKVAKQILVGLQKGKRRLYVTKRWRIIAWLAKLLPEYIYNTRHWKSKTAAKKEG
ncbi:SDR family NAD(P)-dependent oxidoreductase [Shewanella gelidii]|uniref:Short-chain dehydrogenase n=1 Tax=Shewanella gelidii TaxID=1642821 RepID=A0A917JKL8_9GAMM|nr:SDR family NAD(P)-dependent oxidoreductase [Shewanella gelidii]MCL1097361.1 SDR family NAD(P)-dependent oxidoreductase [Shewanella gelidii]GGI74579.1 short-chain dehydrogenase [Shewanella gelidii]